MLDTYDDDPIGTLNVAISLTQEKTPGSWAGLVEELGFDVQRSKSLREGRTEALDELLKYLVENRSL